MYILQISALCILQTILQINYRAYYRAVADFVPHMSGISESCGHIPSKRRVSQRVDDRGMIRAGKML